MLIGLNYPWELPKPHREVRHQLDVNNYNLEVQNALMLLSFCRNCLLAPCSTNYRTSAKFFFTHSYSMELLKAKVSSLTTYGKKHKVAVVGSGNW